MPERTHENHRKRLRARFLETGFSGMAEHEILELILTYSIPRKDVNPLAHELIARFGSLRGVLDASRNDLERISGIGQNTAALLSLLREVSRLLEAPDIKSTRLTTPEKTGAYLRAKLRGLTSECVIALLLNSNFQLIGERRIAEGTVDKSYLFPRTVVECALFGGAAAVILAHNHPGGSLTAGTADLHATEAVKTALAAVGVRLAEHYIVSERGVYGIISGCSYIAEEAHAGIGQAGPALPAVAEQDKEL